MILNETTHGGNSVSAIYGSETEFGYRLIGEAEDISDINSGISLHHASYIGKSLCGQYYEHFGLTENGGRIYPDQNAQLEVATPECRGLHELIKYELAAEEIAKNALIFYVKQGALQGFQLNKRSCDHDNNFWGAHENCSNSQLLDLHKYDIVKLDNLRAAHQASRFIYTGEGGFTYNHDTDQLNFAISPRTAHSQYLFGPARMVHPLVCTDYSKSLNNNGVYGVTRLQNVTAANVSPWAIAVKNGMNSVLIKLVNGFADGDSIILRNPDKVAIDFASKNEINNRRNFAVDASTKRYYFSARELQLFIAETALDNADVLELSKDENWVCQQVIKVCDDMAQDTKKVEDRVDWVARLEYLKKRGYDMQPTEADSEFAHLDFTWDTICVTDTERAIENISGAGIKARHSGKYGWHDIEKPSIHEIQQAVITPPETRAAERISLAQSGIDINDWDSSKGYDLPNPYGSNLKNDQLQELR